MNVYLVGVETSYDYRKFPWLRKNRCSMLLAENIQVIVAESPEEAECKYWDANPNKLVVWPLMPKCWWPLVCKKSHNCKICIKELPCDKDTLIDEPWKRMSPEGLRTLLADPYANYTKTNPAMRSLLAEMPACGG